jgi:3-phosphoshikimate 1-carboxyvinyltransferase
MKIKVSHSNPLSGSITVPGDKSISHRAILLGALAYGKSTFTNFLDSGVTRVMVEAVKALGVKIIQSNDILTIEGRGFEGLQIPEHSLDCGHSATTMRLLAGALVAANIPAILTGNPQLLKRPMNRIIEPLSKMGADIISKDGKAPIKIRSTRFGTGIRGITYDSPVPSAQVKSAIILSGLNASTQTTILEQNPSRDHTERMLQKMGARIRCQENSGIYKTSLSPLKTTKLSPLKWEIPGDFSSAAFLITAAAILPGSQIKIKNVGLNWTRAGLLDNLVNMGSGIQVSESSQTDFEKTGDLNIQHQSLKGTSVLKTSVVRMIDEFPAFAVAAAFADGETIVSDAKELRFKESDRIKAISLGLSECGVDIEERTDGFIIHGNRKDLRGGVVLNPGKDHRLAMAFVLLGLRATMPIVIEEAQIINQSYPGFIQSLKELGVNTIEVIDE